MHLPRRARNQLHIFIIRKARTPRLLKSLFILDAKSDIRFIPEMPFLNPIFKKAKWKWTVDIHLHAMSYFWCDGFDENWKTVSVSFENRCSKCSKERRQIPSRGNFFQQGKLFHCVWGGASKWKLLLSHYIQNCWIALKCWAKTRKYAAWCMGVSEEADFWWWSPLRMMFCSCCSGDISQLDRPISKYEPTIGQRYPALASPLPPLISDILFRHKTSWSIRFICVVRHGLENWSSLFPFSEVTWGFCKFVLQVLAF